MKNTCNAFVDWRISYRWFGFFPIRFSYIIIYYTHDAVWTYITPTMFVVICVKPVIYTCVSCVSILVIRLFESSSWTAPDNMCNKGKRGQVVWKSTDLCCCHRTPSARISRNSSKKDLPASLHYIYIIIALNVTFSPRQSVRVKRAVVVGTYYIYYTIHRCITDHNIIFSAVSCVGIIHTYNNNSVIYNTHALYTLRVNTLSLFHLHR